jgi:radial spoke head protein 9
MAVSIQQPIMGQVLNLSERVAIKNSLTKVKLHEKVSSTAFWGKIQGVRGDYLIAQASEVTDNVSKLFFFSNDNGVTFAKLPDVDDWILERASLLNGRFTGDIAHQYRDPLAPPVEEKDEDEEEEEEPEEEEEDDEEDADAANDEENADKKKEQALPKRKLTELERLAWVVYQIDQDTCIVPRGAYLYTASQRIIPNLAFTGLSATDSIRLSSYGHFRTPISDNTAARLRREGPTNNPNCWDSIEEDQPHGKWVLRVDESGEDIVLRNLEWPGYEFHTKASNSQYTGAYFGTGERNLDLLFML